MHIPCRVASWFNYTKLYMGENIILIFFNVFFKVAADRAPWRIKG